MNLGERMLLFVLRRHVPNAVKIYMTKCYIAHNISVYIENNYL